MINRIKCLFGFHQFFVKNSVATCRHCRKRVSFEVQTRRIHENHNTDNAINHRHSYKLRHAKNESDISD